MFGIPWYVAKHQSSALALHMIHASGNIIEHIVQFAHSDLSKVILRFCWIRWSWCKLLACAEKCCWLSPAKPPDIFPINKKSPAAFQAAGKKRCLCFHVTFINNGVLFCLHAFIASLRGSRILLLGSMAFNRDQSVSWQSAPCAWHHFPKHSLLKITPDLSTEFKLLG